MSVIQTIMSRVEFDPFGGCWLWSGALDTTTRYGRFRNRQAHRLSYAAFVAPVPDDLVIDHKCRVRCCVNPAHLRVVTRQINAVENNIGPAALNFAKTHCSAGHPFDDANTSIRPDGSRRCRACDRGGYRRKQGISLDVQISLRLTPDVVRAVRKDRRGPAVVAEAFGISAASVKRIRARTAWAHVDE